jgi:hypothetical protein
MIVENGLKDIHWPAKQDAYPQDLESTRSNPPTVFSLLHLLTVIHNL